MILRPYEPKDEESLTTMLNAAGLPAYDHAFRENQTIVWDEGVGVQGFFTIEIIEGSPFIRHIYVEPGFRNARNARELLRNIIRIIRKAGFLHVFARMNNPRMMRATEWYFNAKPLVESNLGTTYCIGIRG